MAVKTHERSMPRPAPRRKNPKKNAIQNNLIRRHLPAWMALAAVMVILLPNVTRVTLDAGGRIFSSFTEWASNLLYSSSPIAPLFSPEVQHWGHDIGRWAADNNLDPNLLATVMQIESCGHPTVSSYAGAQGLFQVMPFHFSMDENQLDPNTNARRGADFLKVCLAAAGGDAGLAMACYNGGQSVLTQPYAAWSDQTQRYYYWGSGIYEAASQHQASSERLNEWLAAGGQRLCQQAGAALGM
ncbi:MAG: lytic transglycosylase domain-containing protein [Anaerolineae bacterium]